VISALKTERGLALQDLIGGVYDYVETIEFKPHSRVYLLDQLAAIEYVFNTYPDFFGFNDYPRHRLSTGGSEKIQLTALLGVFKNTVELSAKTLP
jgi:replication factor C subunit 3/5